MKLPSLHAVLLLLLVAAPVYADPLSVANGLVAVGQVAPLAEVGPEADVPIGGPWQQFKFGPAGSLAGACDGTCEPSAGGNSQYAPSPPWTFWAPSGGVQLTVTDAWSSGDIFEVFDFGVSLGTTSSVTMGYFCGNDPAVCVLDPLMSSAVFSLGPGDHSITIKPSASPYNVGTAYFRIDNALPFHVAVLSPGWNLLSWPLQPLPEAEGALDEIADQNGDASEVYRWLSDTDTWEGHVKDLPFNNFPLELGQGYFFKASMPSTWQRTGLPPTEPVSVTLNPVWTLIGVPKLPCAMTAEHVLQDATAQGGDCTELYRWDAELGSWEGHVRGLPFGDFALMTDEGYFVKCAQAITYVPGDGGVCVR